MHRLSRRAFLASSSVAAGSVAAAHATQPADSSARLTLVCANYVRLLPIASGDVRPRDLALTWVRGDRNEMLRRATDDPGVDGGETSMAQHVQRVDRGERSLVAIPIFPLRNFTVRDLYTRRACESPRLAGRPPRRHLQLGGEWSGVVPAPVAAPWHRHEPGAMGGRRRGWPGRCQPAGSATAVRDLGSGQQLVDALLQSSEIDALFAPLPPRPSIPSRTDGPGGGRIPAHGAAYFADTGCYPPQHVIVLRRAAWERDPRSAGGWWTRSTRAKRRSRPFNGSSRTTRPG